MYREGHSDGVAFLYANPMYTSGISVIQIAFIIETRYNKNNRKK